VRSGGLSSMSKLGYSYGIASIDSEAISIPTNQNSSSSIHFGTDTSSLQLDSTYDIQMISSIE